MLNKIKTWLNNNNSIFVVTWLLITVISIGFVFVFVKGLTELIKL